MEKHVTNLELSKRLKALGVDQVSKHYWKIDEKEAYLVFHNSRYMFSKGQIVASAYLASELLGKFPSGLSVGWRKLAWTVSHELFPPLHYYESYKGDVVNVLAEALAYLAENGLIKLDVAQ